MNEANLASLFRKALAQIVERQPVLVVRPALEGPAGGWGLLTSPERLSRRTIEEFVVDALPVIVDARSLFRGPAGEGSGVEGSWPPLGALPIWIRPFHKDGVDAAKEALEESSPLGSKVLRLLVKRLLVDGAGVHRVLFGQTREEARDLFLVASRRKRSSAARSRRWAEASAGRSRICGASSRRRGRDSIVRGSSMEGWPGFSGSS